MECRSRYRSLRQLPQSIDRSDSLFWRTLLLGVLLLVAAPSFCADSPRQLKVLILFSADKDSPALTLFQSGLRNRLEQGLNAPVWISEESFDEGRLGHNSSYE